MFHGEEILPEEFLRVPSVKTDLELSDINQLYQDFYADEPFVQVSEKAIDLKQVVNTNRCVIQIEKCGNVCGHSFSD